MLINFYDTFSYYNLFCKWFNMLLSKWADRRLFEIHNKWLCKIRVDVVDLSSEFWNRIIENRWRIILLLKGIRSSIFDNKYKKITTTMKFQVVSENTMSRKLFNFIKTIVDLLFSNYLRLFVFLIHGVSEFRIARHFLLSIGCWTILPKVS